MQSTPTCRRPSLASTTPPRNTTKGPRPPPPTTWWEWWGNPTSGWQKHWPGKRTRATYWGLREAFERGEGGSIQTDGATEPAPRPRREGQTPKAHAVLGGERAGGGQESLQRTGRMVGGALLGGGGGDWWVLEHLDMIRRNSFGWGGGG